jgi:hypothetical protein
MPASSASRVSWLTRERIVLAGLLAFTLVVRGGVLLALRGKLADDPDAYRRIAENLLGHGVFSMDVTHIEYEQHDGVPLYGRPVPWHLHRETPRTPTAYRPPLYPVVLSNLAAADGAQVSLAKVAGLHLLLGVGTVWLTWLTAPRLQIGNCKLQITNWRMPLVAGIVVACDPILLNQSALVMTETLAAFLAILSLWCLARFDSQRSWFNAGLAGGAMGLAVLCRPTFLPWVALVAVGMLVVRGRISDFRFQISDLESWWRDIGWRVVNCAALIVVAGAVVSPWVIRNQRVIGKPIVTTTHGGYTLWLGNNHSFYEWLRSDASNLPWQAVHPLEEMTPEIGEAVMEARRSAYAYHPEVVEDRFHRTIAISAIADDAGGFVRACFYRLGQLWSPLPNRLTAEESTGRWLLRYAVAAWYCGVYLLAGVGLWRIWKGGPPLRGRPDGRQEGAAGDAVANGEISGGAVLPRSGGPRSGGRALWIWGVLLCVVFTGVHTFYWSNLRMRAPLMPFVALVAGAALLGGNEQPRMSRKTRMES